MSAETPAIALPETQKALMRVGFLMLAGLKRLREDRASGSVTITVHVANGEPAKVEHETRLFEKLEK